MCQRVNLDSFINIQLKHELDEMTEYSLNIKNCGKLISVYFPTWITTSNISNYINLMDSVEYKMLENGLNPYSYRSIRKTGAVYKTVLLKMLNKNNINKLIYDELNKVDLVSIPKSIFQLVDTYRDYLKKYEKIKLEISAKRIEIKELYHELTKDIRSYDDTYTYDNKTYAKLLVHENCGGDLVLAESTKTNQNLYKCQKCNVSNIHEVFYFELYDENIIFALINFSKQGLIRLLYNRVMISRQVVLKCILKSKSETAIDLVREVIPVDIRKRFATQNEFHRILDLDC